MSRILKILGVLALALLVLAVPGADPVVPAAPERGVDFTWDQDAYWTSLEQQFVATRGQGCAAVEPGGREELLAVRQMLGRLTAEELPPDAVVFDSVEQRFFELAPLVAACAELAEPYASLQMFLRDVIKDQSRHWAMSSPAARERAYRLLYGSRLAVKIIKNLECSELADRQYQGDKQHDAGKKGAGDKSQLFWISPSGINT